MVATHALSAALRNGSRMISISIEMSAPKDGHDPVLVITSWLCGILQEESIVGMTVHNIRVEELDA